MSDRRLARLADLLLGMWTLIFAVDLVVTDEPAWRIVTAGLVAVYLMARSIR